MMNLKFTNFPNNNVKNFMAGFLWVLLACVFLGIGPLGMLTNESVSKSVADDNRNTDSVTQDLPIIVEFVPQHRELTSIGFVLNRGGGQVNEGQVTFKLFDGALQLLQQVELPMTDIEDGGMTDVMLHSKVRPGETYYYRIEVSGLGGQAPRLAYRSLSGCGPTENRTFYYGSTVMEDCSPVGRIVYQIPLEAEQLLTWAAFLLFLGLFLTAGIRRLPFERELLQAGAKETAVKWAGSLAAGALAAVSVDFLIVENRFGTPGLDHAVYGIGVGVALCLLWYAIWRIRPDDVKRFFCRWDAGRAAALLRTAMFAAVGVLSMYYYNSGSNYGHRIATRGSMICFGIAILSFYSGRQLFHKWSALYAALLAAAAVLYALLTPMEARALFQYGLSVLTALVWGVLVVRLLLNWREGRVRRLLVWYSAVLFGFFALLVLFCNTRTWPFELAFYFTVLYLQDFTGKEWGALIRDFCNGLVVSFFAILGFSLLFRPYHRYNYSRYPMAFYSVATCALYLTAVFCAALTNLLVQYKKRPCWRKNIGGLFVMSVVFCYTFMTVSRTAYLALAAAGLVTALLLCATWYRTRKSKALVWIGVVLGSGFLLLPTVFTATRSIPALVGMPYIMDAELAHESVLPGMPMDSRRYMNVERFLELTFEKLTDTVRFLHLPGQGGISDNDLQGGGIAVQSSVQVASAKDFVGLGGINDKAETVSNGRADIYRAYLQELNLTGHESMLVETEDGIYYHAHNTFLQTAYDHGIFAGIYFILLGVLSFGRSIRCFRAGSEENAYLLFPVMILVAFGAASLTEWTFHPSMPLAFGMLLAQALLLAKNQTKTA